MTRPLALLLVAVAVIVAAAAIRYENARDSPTLRADWTRTSGALNPAVTQATISRTICVAGWTRTIRPPSAFTGALKVRQMREYGVSGSLADFEEDHLISLELGGSPTDPRNLWPEPRPRANHVDGIENDLHARVCSGDLTLAEAQRRISEIKHTEG